MKEKDTMREYSRGLVLEYNEDFPEEVMRELILRYVDKESRALKEERVQGSWEEEKGAWGSQGGEKDKCFFLHCFILVNITMYLARGHASS